MCNYIPDSPGCPWSPHWGPLEQSSPRSLEPRTFDWNCDVPPPASYTSRSRRSWPGLGRVRSAWTPECCGASGLCGLEGEGKLCFNSNQRHEDSESILGFRDTCLFWESADGLIRTWSAAEVWLAQVHDGWNPFPPHTSKRKGNDVENRIKILKKHSVEKTFWWEFLSSGWWDGQPWPRWGFKLQTIHF